jgi:hypothetical protein
MIYRPITLTFMFLTLTLATTDGRTTDSEIERQLIGTWAEELTKGSYEVKAKVTYFADGKISGEGSFIKQGRKVNVAVTGSWKLDGAKLVETVESCEPPLLRRGKQITSEVVEVNDMTLRYINEFGDERTKTRVTD